jgi:molecular chaperone GrpE
MMRPVFWTDPWPPRGSPFPRLRPSPRVWGAPGNAWCPEVPVQPRAVPVARRSEPEAQVGGAPPANTPLPQEGPRPSQTPEAPDTAFSGAEGEPTSVKSEQDRWREAVRELEAAKQRVEREGERAKKAARAELVAKLFPVLDSLDRSVALGSETDGLADGVKLVRAQLAKVLAEFGVERIDSVGHPFDPQEHEAVDVVVVDTPSSRNHVVEEWEAGYRYEGRVLRPAKVRVGKVR